MVNIKKSYFDELDEKERLAELRRQKVIQSHKCFRCEWSSWTGNGYFVCLVGARSDLFHNQQDSLLFIVGI